MGGVLAVGEKEEVDGDAIGAYTSDVVEDPIRIGLHVRPRPGRVPVNLDPESGLEASALCRYLVDRHAIRSRARSRRPHRALRRSGHGSPVVAWRYGWPC